ncbi:hypothetical protein GF312_06250, partial [Candidatus Poribacteria bacterium]|nr:hypothetical protein [Candidatus Poribacteria bacterium]
MATVNYYLKGALSDKNIRDLRKSEDGNKYLKEYENKPLQIVLKVSSGGKRNQAYTKRRIAPKYWDKSKQRYNPVRYRLNCADNNNWLNDLQYEVEKTIDDLEKQQSRRITQDDLRGIIERKSQNKPSKKSLKEVFDIFLKEHTTPGGNSLDALTIKKYEGFFKHLIKYSAEKNIGFDFYIFNEDFLVDFKEYLRVNVGHADST